MLKNQIEVKPLNKKLLKKKKKNQNKDTGRKNA